VCPCDELEAVGMVELLSDVLTESVTFDTRVRDSSLKDQGSEFSL